MLSLLRSRVAQRLSGSTDKPADKEPVAPPRSSWAETERAIADHYAQFPMVPPQLPENAERLATLERDGIVFIDNLFDAAALARLDAALATDRESMRSGTVHAQPGTAHLAPERGRFRLYMMHERVPETLAFREHPVLVDLVQAYLGHNAQFVDLTLEMRRQPPDWDLALADLVPHTDNFLRELKIYLALEDITDDNGPIIYWTGTHRRGEWRKLPDYLTSLGGLFGETHVFSDYTIGQLMQRSPEFADCRKVRCTLKAGSAFVCDVRGLHRASYLNTGERWHIYSTYHISGTYRGTSGGVDWLQPIDLS
jgi:hypothetical protein